VRLAARERHNQAALEVLDAAGGIIQIHLAGDELRLLAAQLMKIAAQLQASNLSEEVTRP
jgi:hypothetical protein